MLPLSIVISSALAYVPLAIRSTPIPRSPPAVAVAPRDAVLKEAAAKRERGGYSDDFPSGKSETQRCGKIESFADLLQQPDVCDYSRLASLPGGAAHTPQLVARADGSRVHMLMRYSAGAGGLPAPCLPEHAQRVDGHLTKREKAIIEQIEIRIYNENEKRRAQGEKPTSLRLDQEARGADEQDAVHRRRLCYGQPRAVEIGGGRCFHDVSHPLNKRLQERDGAAAERARVVARCRVVSFMALECMGLAPPPAVETAAEADEWLGERSDGRLLGEGLAKSAWYTWRTYREHASEDEAIIALSAIQGFYENVYAATYHFDTSPFWESWVPWRTAAAAARVGGAAVAPTHAPQLRVNFAAEPNRTVWTAGLQKILHAAVDHCDVQPRPPGWAASRGAGETMLIEAAGSGSYDGYDRTRVTRDEKGVIHFERLWVEKPVSKLPARACRM